MHTATASVRTLYLCLPPLLPSSPVLRKGPEEKKDRWIKLNPGHTSAERGPGWGPRQTRHSRAVEADPRQQRQGPGWVLVLRNEAGLWVTRLEEQQEQM